MKLTSAAFALARKDLRLFFRDRTGVLLGFLLPVSLVTIFGYLMGMMSGGGSGGPMPRATVWVADEDGSAQSAAMMEQLRASTMLRLRPRVDAEGNLIDQVRDTATLRTQVQEGDLDLALILEDGFGAALDAGTKAPLTLVRDPGMGMESQLVGIAILQALTTITDGRVFTDMVAEQMRDSGTPEIAIEGMRQMSTSVDMRAMMSGDGLFTTEDHRPPDRDEDVTFAQAQAVGGIAVMMVLFGLTAAASTLLRERDEGTMRRLLSLPMPSSAILLGKALSVGIIGLMQITVLFLVGELLFGIGIWRDPLTLFALMVSTVAAASAFGLLIASWAKTPKQADGMSTLIILVMSCLGGSWFPLQMLDLPGGMEVAMRLTINHWSVSGFQDLFWRTQSLADAGIQWSIGILWLFTAVAGWVSLRLFRRNYLG
ncbi:MAG: ABC transporter permease [Planctomycetota bacterium]|jgi:ABC-2 type transport system permease protein